MTTTMKMILGSFSACLAVGALAAEVSQVTVRQRWPWSRLVDIDYVLSDVTQSVDIEVSGHNGVNPVDVPAHSLSGDLYGVASDGLHRIVWDPTVSGCTNQGVLAKFSVTLTPTPIPLYMIVDLTKTNGAADQIQYVYESDLTNGLWGAWVRNPVTNEGAVIESVVWTGVATNDLYKTDKLVLRRVPAGSYTMGGQGYTEYAVNLTKACYAGVFEVTQRQWELVMTGEKPSYFSKDYAARPLESRSYNDIRGATNSTPAVDWPSTDRTVAPGSFLGKLRDRTGLADFDLPTEAQWEYLCRAGTTTVFNDGAASAKYEGTVENNNGNTNGYLAALGRYAWDGGKYWYGDSWENATSAFGPTNGTAVVGSYAPNAWGLYDTHGNVWEWCLNWYGTPVSGSDPAGAVSGSLRVGRGGSWYHSASYCRSPYRYDLAPSSRSYFFGLRLFRTLP